MKRKIVTGFVLAAVLLAVGLGIVSLNRIRGLESGLKEAERRAETLDQKARNYSVDMDRALQIASKAQLSADTAERRAAEAASGMLSAEDRAAQAEKARSLAEDNARQSLEELAAIRERREQELNRMHEALSRIATTRRTSSGLVVELTNDSFYFDFDKADLRPENREVLSRIAGVLLVSNGYRLFIDGHTDDVGTTDYNQRLSERRAESVENYLISAGIDSDLIRARGFGKSSPRVQGTTPEARQQNRRVEIILVDSIIHYQGEVAESGA